jgi:hypothetical protein
MKSFKGWSNDLDEAIKWGFLKKAFDWIKTRILSAIKKLGFGQTVRVPLSPPNLIIESLMCKTLDEAKASGCSGGLVQFVLGGYGEWCTALHIFQIMDKVNKKRHTFDFDVKKAKIIAKNKMEIENNIKAMIKNIKNPKWNGEVTYVKLGEKVIENVKEQYPNCWEAYLTSIASSWMDYDHKTELGAESIVSLLVDNMEDSEISTFDIEMTGKGGGKGKEGTADIIIHKTDKDKVTKDLKLSLKTYMNGITETKGTTLLGWFQALCEAGDIKIPKKNQIALWMDPDVLSQLTSQFGNEMADFVKMSSDLSKEIFHAIPHHQITSKIPQEQWDNPAALKEYYDKHLKPEAKLYGTDGFVFKTVNQAINQFPEIFEKPARTNKKGEVLEPKKIVGSVHFRKDYIRRAYGIGLNAMGSEGWAKVVEKLLADPVSKRKMISWVLDRMEIKNGQPYLIVMGTNHGKKGTPDWVKEHVVEVQRPSPELVKNWDDVIDTIDLRVKTTFKEAQKFKGFKPTSAKAGHLLSKELEGATPKDYGSFSWELEIPGVKTFTWKWDAFAEPTGEAQLKVNSSTGDVQNIIAVSAELTSKILSNLGIDIHLDE